MILQDVRWPGSRCGPFRAQVNEPSARAGAPLAPGALACISLATSTPTQCLVGRHRNHPGNKQRGFALDGDADVGFWKYFGHRTKKRNQGKPRGAEGGPREEQEARLPVGWEPHETPSEAWEMTAVYST